VVLPQSVATTTLMLLGSFGMEGAGYGLGLHIARALLWGTRAAVAPSDASACSAPSSRALGPWLRGRARSTRARVCAPRRPPAPSGPWLRGRARSTRFRSRSRPSLGGAGTRLRTHRSCRLRDSQSRAAQGRSVAADGASLIDWPRGSRDHCCGRRGTGARHAAPNGSDSCESRIRGGQRSCTSSSTSTLAPSGRAMLPTAARA
jgi:hypothetical protein